MPATFVQAKRQIAIEAFLNENSKEGLQYSPALEVVEDGRRFIRRWVRERRSVEVPVISLAKHLYQSMHLRLGKGGLRTSKELAEALLIDLDENGTVFMVDFGQDVVVVKALTQDRAKVLAMKQPGHSWTYPIQITSCDTGRTEPVRPLTPESRPIFDAVVNLFGIYLEEIVVVQGTFSLQVSNKRDAETLLQFYGPKFGDNLFIEQMTWLPASPWQVRTP